MKTLLFLFLLAAASAAQPTSADLANPTRLGEKKEFSAEGISFQPPEGCVATASDGPDGQRVVAASRIVSVDGRDEPLGLQFEVIGDLDLLTYRRMLEGFQKARGLPLVAVDDATRDGRKAWRVNLPGKPGEPVTRVMAVDAGDRIVVATWSPRDAVAREFGKLFDEAVASLRIEVRDPPAGADDPAEDWAPKGSGVTLKVPAGWKGTERGTVKALRNPRDRFENVAFGLMDGTVDQKAAEWEELKKDRFAAGSCVEARVETFLKRRSFVCRSRVEHQGIPVVSETRLVEHRGKLFFLSMTSREERFEERRKVLDAVLATLQLED